MKTKDRLVSEETFHNEQALERAQRFESLSSLRFTDDWYLNHEPWIKPAFQMLGQLQGKSLLDIGCGHGMASTVFARRGARVTGIDLSANYVHEAVRRAQANEVVAEFQTANAEELPFADQSFDIIWGNAILHHLDLDQTSRELKRVLRPNGIAVFCEPWGGNPCIEFARRYLPYAGKHRTPDETPLQTKHVRHLREHFPDLTIQGFQILGVLKRFLKRESPVNWLDRIDQRCFSRFPKLQMWGRYVVVRIVNNYH